MSRAIPLFALLVAGALVATGWLAALRWEIALYLRGGRAAAVAVHVARLALPGAGAWLAVRAGAPSLVAALVGFSAARLVGARAVLRCM